MTITIPDNLLLNLSTEDVLEELATALYQQEKITLAHYYSFKTASNIVTHLTHDLKFHNLMGFTKSEVEQLLEMCLEDESQKVQIMQDLRDWYNGYQFHLEAK
jgi:hypothetical protein